MVAYHGRQARSISAATVADISAAPISRVRHDVSRDGEITPGALVPECDTMKSATIVAVDGGSQESGG